LETVFDFAHCGKVATNPYMFLKFPGISLIFSPIFLDISNRLIFTVPDHKEALDFVIFASLIVIILIPVGFLLI